MHQSGSGFMGGLITLGLAFLAFYFLLRPKKGEQSPVWNIPFFLVFTLNIYHIFWLYRVFKKLYMYNATETSPGEAVGFLFIPFFNLVWIFIIWSRLGKAISKAYLLSGLSEPSTEIVLLFPLSSYVVFVVSFFHYGIAIILTLIYTSIVLCILQSKINVLDKANACV